VFWFYLSGFGRIGGLLDLGGISFCVEAASGLLNRLPS